MNNWSNISIEINELLDTIYGGAWKKGKRCRQGGIFWQYKRDVQHDLIALNTEQVKH